MPECPSLCPDLWIEILRRTDVWTCLRLCNFAAARFFLQGQIEENNIICEAVITGRLEHLQALLSGMKLKSDARITSVQASNQEELQETASLETSDSLLDLAIYFGHDSVMKWLLDQKRSSICSRRAIRQLSREGRLDIIKILISNNIELDAMHALTSAVETNQLEVFRHIFIETRPQAKDCRKLICLAAKSGSLRVFSFLAQQSDLYQSDLIVGKAASKGQTHILQWMVKNLSLSKEAFSTEVFLKAACGGHLELLKWMHGVGLVDSKVLDGHCIYGKAAVEDEIIQWLKCAFPSAVILLDLDEACFDYPLEALNTLNYGENIQITEAAMNNAAATRASENHSFTLLQWLDGNRTESCTEHAMDHATSLQKLKFLHMRPHSVCTSLAMDNAASEGDLEMVKFLHENRREGCTRSAMHRAACHGHLEVVQWLQANRDEGCEKETLGDALWRTKKNTVAWLWKNVPDCCEDLATIRTDFGEEMPLQKWLKLGAKGTLERLVLTRPTDKQEHKFATSVQCFPKGLSIQVKICIICTS